MAIITVEKKMKQKQDSIDLMVNLQVIEAKLRQCSIALTIIGLLQLASGLHGVYYVAEYGERSIVHPYFHCNPETWNLSVSVDYHIEIVLGMVILAAMLIKQLHWIATAVIIVFWVIANSVLTALSAFTFSCADQRGLPSIDAFMCALFWFIVHIIQIGFGFLYWNSVLNKNIAVNHILLNRQKSEKPDQPKKPLKCSENSV